MNCKLHECASNKFSIIKNNAKYLHIFPDIIAHGHTNTLYTFSLFNNFHVD